MWPNDEHEIRDTATAGHVANGAGSRNYGSGSSIVSKFGH